MEITFETQNQSESQFFMGPFVLGNSKIVFFKIVKIEEIKQYI